MFLELPETLNRPLDLSAEAVATVKLTNVKRDPVPMCGAGVIDSLSLPVILKSAVDSGGLTAIASVVLENPKSVPEPTCSRLNLVIEEPLTLNVTDPL